MNEVGSTIEALRATSDLLVDELRRELLRPRATAPVAGSAASVLVESTLPSHLARMLELAGRAAPRAAPPAAPPAPEPRTWASERARLLSDLASTRESAERAREEKERMVGALADVVRRVSAERDEASAALARLQRASRGASVHARRGDAEDDAAEPADDAGDGGGLALARKVVALRRELRALAVERAALLHGVAAAETIAEARRGVSAADAPAAAPARDALAAAQAAVAAVVESRAAERLRLQLDAAEAVCARQADELAQTEEDAQVAQAFYKTQLAAAELAASDARARAARAEAATEAAIDAAARARAKASELEAQLQQARAERAAHGASADGAHAHPPQTAPTSPPSATRPSPGAARAQQPQPQWRGFLWPRLGDLFGVLAPPRDAADEALSGRADAHQRVGSPSPPGGTPSPPDAQAGGGPPAPLPPAACAPAAAADDNALAAAALMTVRSPLPLETDGA